MNMGYYTNTKITIWNWHITNYYISIFILIFLEHMTGIAANNSADVNTSCHSPIIVTYMETSGTI